MRRNLLSTAVTLFSCVSVLAAHAQQFPNDADYAPFARPGTSVLIGQAFLTTRGGEVKVAAGETVILSPAPPSVRSWRANNGWKEELPHSQALDRARRSTVADAQGKFHFEHLPPGSYIVETRVAWEAGDHPQGGVVAEFVDIARGKTAEVMVKTLVVPDWEPTPVYALDDSIGSFPVLAHQPIRRHKTMRITAGVPCSSGDDQKAAREALAAKAIQLKADALMNVECKGTYVFTRDCTQKFDCTGDAITWN